jgi:DNA-binding transcriptional MerR regulator
MLMKADREHDRSISTATHENAVRHRAPDDLKIGDLARATGKTARALRLYEEMGLLCPGDRSQGGFRMYDGQAIERVRFISELQDMGFTLHDVKALIDATAAREIPREAMEQVRHTFETKLDELNAQITRLTSLRDDVKTALAYISTCGDCALVESGIVQCVTCDDHIETTVPRLVQGVAGSALETRRSVPPTTNQPSPMTSSSMTGSSMTNTNTIPGARS